jgi:maleate isomerase
MVAAKRIGMITPSSNTMVEPITSAMTAHLLDDLSVHYARIPVTRIALDQGSLNQFEREAMLSAARLLADAKVDVICWNGTSGAWKGVAADLAICDAIRAETGIPATTGTLAQLEAFRAHGITRYALAVPYLEDVRDAIVRVYGGEGFACVNSAHLGISTNFAFAEIGLETLRDLAVQADHPDAQAVVVVCTNLAAARVVADLEQQLGKPVHDSLVVSLWHPLRMLGWQAPIPGWGRLMVEFGA